MSQVKSLAGPRISVLLASEAPVAIVFRRGPSKLVRIFSWDRTTDQFTPGQWFKGRIYPDRSDISPDGRHLIYFAMGGVAWAIPVTGGTWTALSRVPSLTALALWPQGDTWNGGGMFLSNDSYWIDTYREPLRNESGLRRVMMKPKQSRMERDGWVLERADDRVFEKRLPNNWTFRRIEHYPKNSYEAENIENRLVLRFPDWEWADWDRNRLVWAERGAIRAARLGADGIETSHTLYDFNADSTPSSIARGL